MAQKPLPDDFKDILKYLNANKVKYLLLGGWAVGIHGNPRATKGRNVIGTLKPAKSAHRQSLTALRKQWLREPQPPKESQPRENPPQEDAVNRDSDTLHPLTRSRLKGPTAVLIIPIPLCSELRCSCSKLRHWTSNSRRRNK